MKNQSFKNVLVSGLCALGISMAAGLTQAKTLAPASPELARIELSPGMQIEPSPDSKIYQGTTLVMLEDGRVYANVKYFHHDQEIVEQSLPFGMIADDAVRFKKSINQLNPNRALVEDPNAEVICDGGGTTYHVIIGGKDVVLSEIRDCLPALIRQDRSSLEVKVIKVLDKIVETYYESLHD